MSTPITWVPWDGKCKSRTRRGAACNAETKAITVAVLHTVRDPGAEEWRNTPSASG